MLEVRLRHGLGALRLEVEFALAAPWTVLFGPSGSGKTTVLRAVAGLVRPEAGRIVSGGRVLVDTKAGVFVPAHARPVRSAAQAARLFPGMSVRENVRYGMGWGSRGSRGEDQRQVLEEVMELLRVDRLAGRRPEALSGGERQRVSVARAVAAAVAFDGEGKVMLLLDEPFAGLDGVLRDEVAVELRDWLGVRGVSVLSVSHDVGECFLLGAEVVRMAEGTVVEQGPVESVLGAERRRLLERLGV